MGLLFDLLKVKCAECGVQIRDKAEVAVQSKKTDRVYFPDMEGSTIKVAPGDKLMKAENVGMLQLGEASKFLCLFCASSIEDAKLTNSTLIECPDCHHQISKRSTTCVHCGCPIGELINSQRDILKPVLPEVVSPKCPTCRSTNVEKISLKSKVGKVALVGIFAIGKVSKTFKCNACGYQSHIQPRSATQEEATSSGVLNPRHFLGRLLIKDSM